MCGRRPPTHPPPRLWAPLPTSASARGGSGRRRMRGNAGRASPPAQPQVPWPAVCWAGRGRQLGAAVAVATVPQHPPAIAYGYPLPACHLSPVCFPAAASKRPQISGVKPKVNTGAKRAAGGSGGGDPKRAMLDVLLSGYSSADQVRAGSQGACWASRQLPQQSRWRTGCTVVVLGSAEGRPSPATSRGAHVPPAQSLPLPLSAGAVPAAVPRRTGDGPQHQLGRHRRPG